LDGPCLIDSPVDGLKLDDVSPEGFSVKWARNHPPEIPTDIKVTMDGKDATPNIPFWMMLFRKGAGMTKAVHNVQPGQTYKVKVSQRSVCGNWSSSTVSVTTPQGLEDTPIPEAIATATQQVNQAVDDASSAISDINDEYYWTETPVCNSGDIFSNDCNAQPLDLEANARDDMSIWEPRYDGAKIDSIMDDGQRTYIKTNDGSPITVYQEAYDSEGGNMIVRVPVTYDAESGVSIFEADPSNCIIFAGDIRIEINTSESDDYGSAPGAQACDITIGPCV
jgi:hypothetical protein